MSMTPARSSLDDFRADARRWLRDKARRREGQAGDRHYDVESLAVARRFQGALHAAGFAGITWPVAYGGRGLSPDHQAVFNEEAEPYDLHSSAFPLRITLAIIGPAILDHGSEEQKRAYLPGMLTGESLWVQLLSEPNAGSDLAALRMRAVDDGGEWVLSGEKVWSSFAHYCDYGLALARTDWDVAKHAGLTMFVVPLKSRGLSVLPLREISGDDEFCQEFFDEVRLPPDAVLGGVNHGWSVALSLFNHSRAMTSGADGTGPTFDPARGGDPDPGRDLVEFANRSGLAGDHTVRQLIAEAVVDNVVSGLLTSRIAAAGDPALASMSKVFGSAVLQRRSEIDLELRAESAVAWREGDSDGPRVVHDYMFARTASIAGGTHEVLLTTIGERVLRLPKAPAADAGIPFRDIGRASAGNQPSV
jgi:alkylation response protein AidB-like acyl-CoA dehydrogenase